MLKALIILMAASGFSELVTASDKVARAMVPQGTVSEGFRREYVVKTRTGSKVRIEFSRSKAFAEASGTNLNKGDEIEPGNGLLSLSSAAHLATKHGKPLGRSWNLEEDPKLGWVYEIESEDEGRSVDLVLDARSGDLLAVEDRSMVSAE